VVDFRLTQVRLQGVVYGNPAQNYRTFFYLANENRVSRQQSDHQRCLA